VYAFSAKTSRLVRPILLFTAGYPSTTLLLLDLDQYFKRSFWRRGGYERICGARRALEMAAEIREGGPWKGARWTTARHMDVEPPLGASQGRVVTGEAARSSGGGHHDQLPPGKHGSESFGQNSCTQHLFKRTAHRPLCSTNPSPS
jgi:hypothetical protein